MSRKAWPRSTTRCSKSVTDLPGFNQQAFRIAGRLLFSALLSLGPSAHAADLYKWTDGQGKVHYSDQPPTGKVQAIKSGSAAQADTTNQAVQSLNAQDQAFQKRRKDADEARAKAEKEAEQQGVKRENCTRARNNFATLQKTPRVYTTNAAGQRVYMDDSARASALASSQKAISEFCN